MNYWLLKSEPDVFSIDDLEKQNISTWDGVRNYQARNFMRDQMKAGDQAYIYHSSCEVPGIAGIGTIVKEAFPDLTALDPKSPYYDQKATAENPRWCAVKIQFKEKWDRIVTLNELRNVPKLKDLLILRKGNRLSITPLKDWEFHLIRGLV